MSRLIAKGAVDQSIYLEILDSSSTNGARKTGLVYNSAGLTAYYVRNGGSATAITLATLAAANSAHSDGGFKEVDATNMPGVYRLDLPDAAVASGADSVVVTVKGASGAAQVSAEIQLTGANLQDTVRGGLTALPNAAAEAAGGLPTLSAAQGSNGTINVNVHRWLTGTPNALQSGRVDSYLGAVASGVIAAASFAANALDAVWSTTTRVLTAGTNIVLAKGTGVTGFNDLDAAGVRSAVGLASANLDTQIGTLATAANLATVAGYIDTEVAAIKAKTDNLPSDPADASDIAGAFGTVNSTLATIAGYIDTEIAAILADTNEMQTDLADGGRLDLLIDAIKAKTDSLTFTASGYLDSNVLKVNGVTVTGIGTEGDPWGP